jgi:hypothetical protein
VFEIDLRLVTGSQAQSEQVGNVAAAMAIVGAVRTKTV